MINADVSQKQPSTAGKWKYKLADKVSKNTNYKKIKQNNYNESKTTTNVNHSWLMRLSADDVNAEICGQAE